MVMMTFLQGSKRDTDVKNRLLDCMGEGEGGMIWENCWGPAAADPGYSKRGRHQRGSGYNSFN